ncbi:MAG: efflux RND transporter periplasmic adaptor subunit [Proteobacteria bacterium]|nr:efflux RND transporter periplasmic adaptor subunit [Pseudomonadota bacterium]
MLGAIALAAAGGGYGLAHMQMSGMGADSTSGEAGGGRRILYWYDPMVPNERYPGPGKSSMNMELIPKYADEGAESAPGVRIDPALTQNLGVRLAVVERGTLEQSLQATGVVEFNERDVAMVQPRAAGFVERTYRRAPGDVVRAGAPLADVYVPEWAGAQTEFLALRRTGERSLIEAGRQRLRLTGMPPALISQVERTGRARPVTTITTPIGGVIQTLNVRPGMTVSEGQTLAEVNGLGTVWLNVAIPEAQAGQVRAGQAASASFAAYPGQTFTGRVTTILPSAQAETRTLEARVELPNPNGRIRPGMFATVELTDRAQRPALLVPAEAVIRTGRRNIVMLALANGRFQPAQVRIGREDGGRLEILAGLQEGERVVASGQFLIDSEASLADVEARPIDGAPSAPVAPTPAPQAAAPAARTGGAGPGALHASNGRIEAINPQSVTLSHQPVPTLGWPAMTMAFRMDDPALARGLKAGDRVSFAFVQAPQPTVRRMNKLEAAR